MRLKYLLITALALTALPALAQNSTETQRIRFGIIGTDTSHVIAFSKLLNHPEAEDHIPGAVITHAYKGGSPDIPSSADRVDGYAEQLEKEHGVEIVDSIEELLKHVDAVMLESVDGRPHLEQVKPVFAARKPVYIDKPFAGSLKDAIEIARLAKESGTPCWSSSSLRYFSGVTELIGNEEVGEIHGVTAYSPADMEEHHPDLYWYGIHGVEILYTLMDAGCTTVTRAFTPDYDSVTGVWDDGRIGDFRGIRKGRKEFGALVFGSKSVQKTKPVSGNLYIPLVEEIVKFAQTGEPPVPLETTVEIMAFMEAADESKRRGGAPVTIQEVMDKARQN